LYYFILRLKEAEEIEKNAKEKEKQEIEEARQKNKEAQKRKHEKQEKTDWVERSRPGSHSKPG
jgi:hypothetical protein